MQDGGGGRQAIIEATIKLSPLWASFQLSELTHPQRDAGDIAYSNFVDLIGDGRLPATHATATMMKFICLELLAVSTNEDEAISFVYFLTSTVCFPLFFKFIINKSLDRPSHQTLLRQLDISATICYAW